MVVVLLDGSISIFSDVQPCHLWNFSICLCLDARTGDEVRSDLEQFELGGLFRDAGEAQ